MTAYRYTLLRQTGLLEGRGYGLFVMLNPSTADRWADDPTIRRCLGFASREGWAGFKVVNLYAARATDPAGLVGLADPVGPENYKVLVDHIRGAGEMPVVAAWGATEPKVNHHVREVFRRLVAQFTMDTPRWWCLGVTTTGAPRHPLYVRKDQPLVRWNPNPWTGWKETA